MSPESSSPPGRSEAALLLLALITQQGAFVSIPMLVRDMSMGEMRDFDNVYNTAALSVTASLIAWELLRHKRELLAIARANMALVLFTGVALASTLWSIHPAMTFRRAVGHALTVVLAALLPLRFGVKKSMKFLSAGFAVSSIASAIYTVVFPQYGIMHVADLEGNWQGVFSTKEMMGSVMAVAILTELYILFSSRNGRWWRAGFMLPLYATLLVLSRSMTSMVEAAIFLTGAAAFLAWQRWQWRGLAVMATSAAVLTSAFATFAGEPGAVLKLLGKDPTLTGRTYLWKGVDELISERPFLGWGYRAVFHPGDRITSAIDFMAGFDAPSAHNTFRQVWLTLGLAGLLALLLVILTGVRRGVACCRNGPALLGWFLLILLTGCVFSGWTTESMGMNQAIEWLVLTAFIVSGGLALEQAPAAISG